MMKSNKALVKEFEERLKTHVEGGQVGVLRGNRKVYLYGEIERNKLYMRKSYRQGMLEEDLRDRVVIYLDKIFDVNIHFARSCNENNLQRFMIGDRVKWSNEGEGIILNTNEVEKKGIGIGCITEEEGIGFYIMPIQSITKNVPFKVYGYIKTKENGIFHLDHAQLKEIMNQLCKSNNNKVKEVYRVWMNLHKDLLSEGKITSAGEDVKEYVPSWLNLYEDLGVGIKRKSVLHYQSNFLMDKDKVIRYYYHVPKTICKRLINRFLYGLIYHFEKKNDKRLKLSVEDGMCYYDGETDRWDFFIRTPIGYIEAEGKERYYLAEAIDKKIHTLARLKNTDRKTFLQQLWWEKQRT